MAYEKLGILSTELTCDLIIEIFSRVPVKDLIRSSCVSKSWSSIIHSDPHLSLLQLHHTASKDRPFLVIEDSCNYCNYWIDSDSIDDQNAKFKEIHNPWINEYAHVVGSCHGLLLLQHRRSHKIALLNPTTKKHHLVPPHPAGHDKVYVIGFGYDQVHACYKLVATVKPTSMDDHIVELMIYDVNNRTWRKSKFDINFHLEGVYMDGALYWCNDLGDTELMKMIRFVLAREEFEEVEPPKFGEIIRYDPNMSAFDGRLCLACDDYSKPNCGYTLEFWLMEAECDEKHLGSSYPRRWTKFLSIHDPESLLAYGFRDPYLILIPICFSACGNKIFCHARGLDLFWYDLGKKEFTEMDDESYGSVGVTCCVRSLIGNGIF